jgi:predicted short-subunit dehydrogenase-like oxidoreductase (DUF2520 family)
MTIAFIGSGNMSSHLIPAFKSAGYEVTGLYSRNAMSASQLAAVHGIRNYASINDITADIIFLCVKDDSIESVATQLQNHDALIVHTSGSTSSSVLTSNKNYGVFYPVQSMKRGTAINFEALPICVLGSTPENSQILKSIANAVSKKVYDANDDQRLAIHLSAVITNNFVNHLIVVAKELLEDNNLDYDIIQPLLANTLEKLAQKPYNFQQTGPASRGDTNIINKHLDLLNENPLLKEIYQSITNSIIQHENHRRNQ